MGSPLVRYCRSEDDFRAIHQRVKLTACPHCKCTGTLILHGWLFGYGECEDNRKARRGRRVFCNNRKQNNNGCGQTVSIWLARTLPRLRLNAESLWAFFQLVLCLGNTALALRDSALDCSISSAYRLWKRFRNGQSRIRTALSECAPPPHLPDARDPIRQTMAHLNAAFPFESCPILAFQIQFQIPFLH